MWGGWGGLRQPIGPFQVSCVLAAAVLAAGSSISTAAAWPPPPAHVRLPPADATNLGDVGARTGFNAVASAAGELVGTVRPLAVGGKGGVPSSRRGCFAAGVDLENALMDHLTGANGGCTNSSRGAARVNIDKPDRELS